MAEVAPTVVIGEPEVGDQRLIDLLLSPDQYTVEIMSNGEEVAEYLRSHTPDLLVLDAMLPKLSGLEICGKMRRVSRLKHVPVVIVIDPKRQQGEFTPTVLHEMAKLVKADAVLQKPLGDKNLRARVKELLSTKAGRISTGRTPVIPSPYDTQVMAGSHEVQLPLPATELAAIAQDLQRVQEQLKALASTQQRLQDDLNALAQRQAGDHAQDIALAENELGRLHDALAGLIARHDQLQQKMLAEIEDIKVHSYAIREGFRELSQRQAEALAPVLATLRVLQEQKEGELARLEALRLAQLTLARTLVAKRLEGLKLEEAALQAQLADLDDSPSPWAAAETPEEADEDPPDNRLPGQDDLSPPVPGDITELQERLRAEYKKVQELETRNRLLLRQLTEQQSKSEPRGLFARWRGHG